MELSRRKFIKGGLVAAGAAAALGGVGVVRGLFADGITGEEKGQNQSGNAGQTVNSPRALRYLDLEQSGELERREKALWALFEPCRLCPRLCGANRASGVAGMCTAAQNFKVASFGPHFGEETPLRGRNGSGTIFFSNCNLLCVFCLNWQIAHRGDGEQTTHAELANMMLNLQRRGCHNINLVTPTHLIPHIIKALRLAIAEGLTLPLLYNSSGYESLEALRLLDGIVDVYLPDFKYQDSALGVRFSKGAPDYTLHTAAAIKEMHRQVGVLQQADGVAQRGLLIRHLVLPENLGGTDTFVRWVVSELGPETHVNIMGQYTPMFQAREHPPLDRRVTQEEFAQAMRWAREAGLRNFH
ncbi:MAG: twin-arginine translocation signal domain-containing protein [Chitinispirillales bacterium]|jgi:putative pyruvate formate lyase activating enzyme|nr:twin-arginine translocation signal domain-containing protein [Chitinispirillales bacterium]